MKKRNHSRATISTYETVKKIRGDWGAINPVTRRIENKKRNFIPNYEEEERYWERESYSRCNPQYDELYDDFDWEYDEEW